MKDTILYLVGKVLVKGYEKTIVYSSENEEERYQIIKNMNEVAHECIDDDDPRFNELGVRIAKANLAALANMKLAE